MLQKQQGFQRWNLSIITSAFIAQFIYSEMQSDIFNTYYNYLVQEGTVWTRTNMTIPVTIASYCSILFIFFGAMLLTKLDNRIVGVVCMVVTGLCTIGIGLSANENFAVWSICIFLTCISGRILILAIQGVVTNWYITTRGRVMGIYTMAAPLGTAFFPNFLVHLVELTNPGVQPGEIYDFSKVWTILGIVIIVVGIAFLFILRSKPEDVGLYPDGVVRSPEEIEALTRPDPSIWTVKKLLKTKETWTVAIGSACWLCVMAGFMGIFVPVMAGDLGIPPTTSVWYLTLASLAGMVISYLWGVIDDKFGTPIACMGLSASYFFMSLAMFVAILTQFKPLIFIAVAGIAFATGGIPNLQPSVFAYVYGRKQFMYANKVLNPIMIALAAPWGLVFNMIQGATGSYRPSYIICMIAAVIGFICFFNTKTSYDPERKAIKGAVVLD